MTNTLIYCDNIVFEVPIKDSGKKSNVRKEYIKPKKLSYVSPDCKSVMVFNKNTKKFNELTLKELEENTIVKEN